MIFVLVLAATELVWSIIQFLAAFDYINIDRFSGRGNWHFVGSSNKVGQFAYATALLLMALLVGAIGIFVGSKS